MKLFLTAAAVLASFSTAFASRDPNAVRDKPPCMYAQRDTASILPDKAPEVSGERTAQLAPRPAKPGPTRH